MSDPVKGVVIAHASLSSGLVGAVRQISGMGDDVIQGISNEGKSPEELAAAIHALIGDSPAVLFTDLGSGSCSFVARKLAHTRPRTGVVSGVNLPVLIEFVYHRDQPLADLVTRLVERGRGGIGGACTENSDVDRTVSS